MHSSLAIKRNNVALQVWVGMGERSKKILNLGETGKLQGSYAERKNQSNKFRSSFLKVFKTFPTNLDRRIQT